MQFFSRVKSGQRPRNPLANPSLYAVLLGVCVVATTQIAFARGGETSNERFVQGTLAMVGKEKIASNDVRFNPAASALFAAAQRAGGGMGGKKEGLITVARVEKVGPNKFTKSTFIIVDGALMAHVRPLNRTEMMELNALFKGDSLSEARGLVIDRGALVGTMPN